MDFKKYQKITRKTAIYPLHLKIIYPVMGLAGETGEVSEKIKKVFRDKNGEFSTDIKQEILKEIGDVLWYLAAICSDLGLSLEDAAEMNVEKLLSRLERDKVKGSGDNR